MRKTTITPNYVDSAEARIPAILRRLRAREPRLGGALDELRSGFPAFERIGLGLKGPYYRLWRHNRTFCQALSLGKRSPKLFDSGTLVFKGTEPYFGEFADYLRWFQEGAARVGGLPVSDHFILVEGKIPGVLTHAEASAEFEAAVRVHEKHFRAYGEIAEMPVPLFLHRFPKADEERCLRQLRTVLPPRPFEKARALASCGMAAAVFYFPYAPVRALSPYEELEGRTRHLPGPEEVIRKWTRLFARLLLLGEMPWTPWNTNIGCCFDLGNATYRGGVCDLDSIVPFGEIRDDELFVHSLMGSLHHLEGAAATLIGGVDTQDASFRSVLSRYLIQRLLESLETERHSGLSLDPRIKTALTPKSLEAMLGFFQKKKTKSDDFY